MYVVAKINWKKNQWIGTRVLNVACFYLAAHVDSLCGSTWSANGYFFSVFRTNETWVFTRKFCSPWETNTPYEHSESPSFRRPVNRKKYMYTFLLTTKYIYISSVKCYFSHRKFVLDSHWGAIPMMRERESEKIMHHVAFKLPSNFYMSSK